MNGHMTFIQMSQLGLSLYGNHGALGNEDGYGRTLGLIILTRNIEHRCANHVRQPGENIGQTFRVILLVNIGDIVLLLPWRFGIAHVIDIKTQRLCQIIEAV